MKIGACFNLWSMQKLESFGAVYHTRIHALNSLDMYLWTDPFLLNKASQDQFAHL